MRGAYQSGRLLDYCSMCAISFCLLSILLNPVMASDEARLMRFPDITRASQGKIVFVYADDIWLVPSEGGMARRLTSHIGSESYPKFSPDGSSITFTGVYDENWDIYTMPAEGGEPIRLTYHPGIDRVVDWYHDGKQILFLSRRESYSYRFNRLFRVSADGGFPEALPLPHGGQTSFSPDGKKIAYTPIEREFRTWKRYKGGMAQDIWIYDLGKNTAEKITDFDGTDAFPMWYQDRIYFISDRDHTMNIYRYDLKTKAVQKITDHKEYDVKFPSLGDDAIVYENGGYLYVLDLTTEKSRKLTIQVPSERFLARQEFKNVSGLIYGFDISPSGSRAVFNARGEIFTVPAKKGEVRNITNTPAIREIYPVWSPDGKWVAYLSDRTGEYELFIKSQDGKGDETQITTGSKSYMFQPIWSPDSKKLLFSDKTQTLFYIDIDEKKLTKIDRGEIFDIYSYDWSSDGKWVTYSKVEENYFSSIYLYSLDKDKVFRVTTGFTDDHSPKFDPEGKYLYFLSERTFSPIFNVFEHDVAYQESTNICVATLRADLPSPFEPESDEEKGKEEKKEDGEEKGKEGAEKSAGKETGIEKAEEKEKGEKKGEKDGEEKKKEDIKIDIEGLADRVVSIPIKSGNYFGMIPAKGKIFYISASTRPVSIDSDDGFVGFDLHLFDMQEREDKVVLNGINGYALSASGEKVLYASKGQFGIVDAKPGQKVGDGKIKTEGLEMRVDPKKEWEQMFKEAWRLERDFFYDPNMHGVDWDRVKERYEQLLPYVAHRSDLNYILGEMIAELSCSHTYVGGGDIPQPRYIGVGLMGCDLEPDTKSGFYRFKKIYSGNNWDKQYRSPLTEPGINVREGDYLIRVNDQLVKYPDNPYYFFENLAGNQVTIKVNSKPEDGKPPKKDEDKEKNAKKKEDAAKSRESLYEGVREFTITTIGDDQNLRYLDWVEGNRQKVDAATNGKVGYIHVPDTSLTGLIEFSKAYYPQVRKEGLIVDVRYNSGGMIPDLFIERLRQEVVSLWARRHAKDFITPATAVHGHMVCIINAYAGSGGDAFPYYFKRYGLGPLIGTRTWGGLVGISRGLPLMDGGSVTMPEFAMWNLEGQWDVENYGVPPDIEVENRPDLVVAGKDPQLEKAIEVVMEKIEKEPKKFPSRPPYPVRN